MYSGARQYATSLCHCICCRDSYRRPYRDCKELTVATVARRGSNGTVVEVQVAQAEKTHYVS